MTTEVPTADWATLFRELPVAIEQLRSHDAYCAYEAAELMECALDVLRAFDPVRAYDHITQTLGGLCRLAKRYELASDTACFFDVMGDDLAEGFAPRGEQEVIKALSRSPGKEQGHD